MQVAIDNTRYEQNESVATQHTLHVIVPPVFKKKRTSPKCPHGNMKCRCRECGGASICEHNKRREICRECGGSRICEHGKHKEACRKCNGRMICVHNKWKVICRACGGSKICIHDRQRESCRDCGGSQICIHDKAKSCCRHCGGSQLCEHNRRKSKCVDCGGFEICKHKKMRTLCRECDGRQLCEHEKRKDLCSQCGGRQICSHGKVRSTCPQCPLCHVHMCEKHAVISTGSVAGYCWREVEGSQEPSTGNEIHNELLAAALLQKMEFTNADLDSFHQDFFYDTYIKVENKYYTPAGACAGCARDERRSRIQGGEKKLHHWLHKQGVKLISLPTTVVVRKKKETKVKNLLDINNISYVNDKREVNRDATCESSSNRPDFQVRHENGELVTIYIEVDEYQHRQIESTCELSRLNNLLASFENQRHLVVLRYNPDVFNVGGKRITFKEFPRREREKLLLRELNYVKQQAADPDNFKDILTVIYIGFDCQCTTPCGYIHTDRYKDQAAISKAYEKMGVK